LFSKDDNLSLSMTTAPRKQKGNHFGMHCGRHKIRNPDSSALSGICPQWAAVICRVVANRPEVTNCHCLTASEHRHVGAADRGRADSARHRDTERERDGMRRV
jgi:hypothetical protein